jgi:hypothetical protein
VLDWTASGKGEGEHRLQQDFLDWLADGHTLSEKITLIFSTGFGEYNEEKNLNPIVWPVLMDLADGCGNRRGERVVSFPSAPAL